MARTSARKNTLFFMTHHPLNRNGYIAVSHGAKHRSPTAIVHGGTSPPSSRVALRDAKKNKNAACFLANDISKNSKAGACPVNSFSMSSFSTARRRDPEGLSRIRCRLDSAGPGQPVGVSRPFRAAAYLRADASPNEESVAIVNPRVKPSRHKHPHLVTNRCLRDRLGERNTA